MAVAWFRRVVGRRPRTIPTPGRGYRTRRLTMEVLEDRSLPTTYGVPWGDPRHITLSFAPDGTAISHHQSTLFQTLNARFPTAVWQAAILQAFQTWAVYSNISIGVVPDDGEPFGVPGLAQGDPRFGDIRIGAIPMSPTAYSVSVPHDPFFAGTWAGDVLLNSALAFDPYAIALHEAGHVFGLADSTDPNSVMYSNFNQNTQLTSGDIAAIQALYGVRAPGPNEGSQGNETLGTATSVKYTGNYDGTTPLVVYGDITTTSDVDVFGLKPFGSYQGAITFRLQTAGISFLAPRLTVMDAAGTVLGQATATGPFGSVLTVSLANVDPAATYFAQVDSTASDGFAIGRYALAMTFDDTVTMSPALLDAVMRGPYDKLKYQDLQALFLNPTTPLFNDDEHTDDTLETANALTTAPGYVRNTRYEVQASLSDALDQDYYQFNSPMGSPHLTVMTLTVAAMQVHGVTPHVSVYDKFHNPVSAQILANGNDVCTIQVSNVGNNALLFVEISGYAFVSGSNSGNYALTISFGQVEAQLRSFTQGTVTADRQQETHMLYAGENQLFQFLLSADSGGTPPSDASVTMTITDSAGNIVFTLTAHDGDTVSNSIFLPVGAYTVVFTLVPGSSLPLPDQAYTLRGNNLSDPIGTGIDDPTQNPYYVPGSDPPLFSYPGGIFTTDPYYIV
jgi:Matrixin